MSKSLSLIVPVFNESKTLPTLLSQFRSFSCYELREIIFVDDGSTDSSLELLKNNLINFPHVAILLTKTNGGKGSAIKVALDKVTATHVLIVDADLELSLGDIHSLWSVVIRGESDFVFGYRTFVSQSSFSWRYSRANKFLSECFGLLFNVLITDIMCGYKLVPTKFLREIPFKKKGFAIEYEIPMEMIRSGVKPFEIPVSYSPRTRDSGKGIFASDGIKILFSMLLKRIEFMFRL